MLLNKPSRIPSLSFSSLQLAFSTGTHASGLRHGSVCAALHRAWILPLCLLPLLASAQQAPLVTPRDLRPETSAKPPVELPQPAPAVVPPNAEELFVRIGDVSIKDGFPEFATDTEALVSQIRKQRISVAQLYKLAESIELLYYNAGFALVRVVVPPQSLNDGDTVNLIVLDGFIERIDVSAVDERARSRVLTLMQSLLGQSRVSGDVLERALTLAGRVPGLELRSTMGAGTAPGGVVLVLDGTFTRASGSLSADDRQSSSLGPWQSILQVTLNQPLGVDMQIYANLTGGQNWDATLRGHTPRRVTGGGAIIPIGASGLFINPEFTSSVSQPVPQVRVPQSLSKFERYTLRLVYPLVLNRQQELTLTGALDVSNQSDTLPEFEVFAADGSSRGPFVLDQDRLRVARVGATWSKSLNSSSGLNMGATFSSGMSQFGARTKQDVAATGVQMSRADADPGFLKLEGSVVYMHRLDMGVQSKSSLRAQKALKGVLPSSELFSLDGEDALSTFTSGSISDDGGWMLRQEFSQPMAWQLSSANINFEPKVFAAAGKKSSQLATGSVNGLYKAFGIGLRAQWRSASLSMEYGRHESAASILNDNKFFIKGQVQF